MKIAATIARYLLGLIFLVFGLNHFVPFIPMGPMPTGVAGQFFGALIPTGYMYVVAFFEVVPAILLLVNRYVPLALTLVAPVIVNIVLTIFLIAHNGAPMAVVLVVLWLLIYYRCRSAFSGLFLVRVEG